MPWLEWFAHKHPMLVHVPVAVALLLPLAVLSAQRPGRGIRPWWLVSRYLAWWGWLGMGLAAISGLLLARTAKLLAPGQWLAGRTAETAILRTHQFLALAALVAGVVALRFLHRRRQDHQNLGFLALATSLLWVGVTLATAYQGFQMTRPVQTVVVTQTVSAPVVPEVRRATPAVDPLARMADVGVLEPIQPEPVKTTMHGLRWIRTYVTPEAAEAYRRGEPLPAGTRVVLATWEDRWGRPGYEPGPFYGLEVATGGKFDLSVYWPRIPVAKRGEFGGAESVRWKAGDANLETCMGCHAQGMAPVKDRSRVFPFRKPKTEDATAQP